MEYRLVEGMNPGFADARRLRTEVFIEEQGFTPAGEFDALDAESLHVIGYEAGEPVCVGRLYTGADGALHFGRFAVRKSCRGKGVGLLLLQEMQRVALQRGATAVVLSAQADKTGFYERAGFAKTGNTSLDEGMPHAEMVWHAGG